MTQTVKRLNYPEFFRNFQRFERGELRLGDVERLSVEETATRFAVRLAVRDMLIRLHFLAPFEFYRGGWGP